MKVFVRALLALATGGTTLAYAADAPFLIPFQGHLATLKEGSTSDYAPVPSGQYDVLFTLYATPVGGESKVWGPERHVNVVVVNGLVNVMIGSVIGFSESTVEGFDPNQFFGRVLYVGITVDADGNENTADLELVPRQALLPAIYSLEAGNARHSEVAESANSAHSLSTASNPEIPIVGVTSTPVNTSVYIRGPAGTEAGQISLEVNDTTQKGFVYSNTIQTDYLRLSDPQLGKPNIILDGDGEQVTLRGYALDEDGKDTITMNTESGGLTAGTLNLIGPPETSVGQMVLRDGSGNGRVEMNGGNGQIVLTGPPSANTVLLEMGRPDVGTVLRLIAESSGGRINIFNEQGVNTYTLTHSGGAPVSDKRLKTDIESIDHPLEKIAAIDGVYYNWKEGDPARQLGVVAQDVESVFPELVETTGDGYKAVHYDRLVAPLIAAVNELRERQEALSKRVTTLEGSK